MWTTFFFSFADAVLLNWNCVERPGPCWSRIDRPSTTVFPPSWPAYSRSRRTTMAAELLDVHGLILVIIFHVCTHSFFFVVCWLFPVQSERHSLARASKREVSFFFIFLLCIDGRVSRRSRPDDVTTHSAESHTWLLLVVPMPPPFVFNGGKKPAALEIDLFLFRLVVPVVDSVSIETMCSSSSSSSSSPLSSSLSFLTLSGQPNESYRSTARPAGKI